MSTKTEQDVFAGVDFDIESMLDNDIKHFRSMHIMCMGRIRPGSIVEANCGQLYRTTGKIAHNTMERCEDCQSLAGKLPCATCGKPVSAPPFSS